MPVKKKMIRKNNKPFVRVTNLRDLLTLNCYLLICLFGFIIANKVGRAAFNSDLLFHYRDITLYALWGSVLFFNYNSKIRELLSRELERKDLIRGIELAVALTCLLYTVKFAAVMLTGKYNSMPQQETEIYRQTIGTFIFHSFVAILVGPTIEEIIFRGLFYPPLRTKLGPILAIIASAVIFAAWHFGIGLSGLINIFIIGLLLAFIYEKTESLLSIIIAHGIINGNLVIVLIYEKVGTSLLKPKRFTLYVMGTYIIVSMLSYYFYRKGEGVTEREGGGVTH